MFKIGDKVIITDSLDPKGGIDEYNRIHIGKKGTIIKVKYNLEYYYQIQLDQGMCLPYNDTEFKLINSCSKLKRVKEKCLNG